MTTRIQLGPRMAAVIPFLLALLSMLGPFAVDMPFPAFADIQADLDVDSTATQQLVSFYLLSFGVMSAFHGPLSDAIGRRRVMAGSLLVFMVASIGCALAPNMATLLVLRVLQGLSAGGSVIVSRTIIADVYDGPRAQQLMSQVMLIFGLAPAVAPILGGFLLQFGSWRLVFWALVVLAAVMLGAVVLLPESLPVEERRPLRVGSLVSGLAHVMTDVTFLRIALAGGFIFGALFAYISSSAILMVDLLGQGETDFWMFFVPMIVGMTIGSTIAGRSAGRIPADVLISRAITGGVVVALLNVLSSLFAATAALPWAVLGPAVLAVVVMAGYPATQLRVIQMFPASRGSATSGATFIALGLNAFVAGAVAPLVTGSLTGLALTTLVMALCAMGFCQWHLAAERRKESRESREAP